MNDKDRWSYRYTITDVPYTMVYTYGKPDSYIEPEVDNDNLKEANELIRRIKNSIGD